MAVGSSSCDAALCDRPSGWRAFPAGSSPHIISPLSREDASPGSPGKMPLTVNGLRSCLVIHLTELTGGEGT